METGQHRGRASRWWERIWPASVHISSKTSRHDSTRNIVLNQHSELRLGLELHHLDVDDNANMKIMQEFSPSVFSLHHLMTGDWRAASSDNCLDWTGV